MKLTNIKTIRGMKELTPNGTENENRSRKHKQVEKQNVTQGRVMTKGTSEGNLCTYAHEQKLQW